MRLLTFHTPTGLRLGVKTADGIVDVATLAEQLKSTQSVDAIPASIEAFCADVATSLPAIEQLVASASLLPADTGSWLLAEKDLQYGPCVPVTGKIICIGLNYRRHAIETGMAIPTSPVLFPKYANSLAANGDTVTLQDNAVEYDYEAELAVVIGREAKYVSEEKALEYVLGYCNANDLSARDLQFRSSQWMLGKFLDQFLPVGPYLVTADEVGDPQNLSIRCTLNGELRQNSTTGDMVFSVAQIISYLSQYMTLAPGDIISTGTPEGVIMGMKERKWLVPGDKVVVEVEGLGQLVNTMK
ncbi:MAG TPA: fumarylacetoacetate hydrolase family protein [Ktedonobacteraceae bacterium]|jgi:2-keto-4-pentenoate hydratase/2-oxohepta-3-ene-1,7-dioic acid hydratase in catechol pathway|nr:fumarylacetoacetate hydrolase family protein [Ktedonobacteraceae bacterium]